MHGPEELGYVQVTEAMVNIRATIDRARQLGVISPALPRPWFKSRSPNSTRTERMRRSSGPQPSKGLRRRRSSGSCAGFRKDKSIKSASMR